MFSASCEWYDALYAQVKDYRAEARGLAAFIRARSPRAATLLDVACGTGEHAKWLAADGAFRVDGLDVEPGFVAIAAAKVPGGRFAVGDMADFALDARYDVVACLFGSIGYLPERAALVRALRCFRAHTGAGGLILVEPWLEPEQWQPGRVTQLSAALGNGLVTRVSHAGVEGTTSLIDFHYLAASPAGIEHRYERHCLQLRTRAEMTDAFAAAGLEAEYHEPGGGLRGLYCARLPE